MDKEQRKAWQTLEGVSLLKAMAGEKPMEPKDRETLARIKAMGRVERVEPLAMAGAEHNEAKLMPILARVLDVAFRMGYHKFKEASRFALNTIRERVGDEAADSLTLDHLQGAYIAMSGKYREQGADTKRAVIDVESLNEILEGNEHVDDTNSGAGVERHSGGISAANGMGAEGVPAGRDGVAGGGEQSLGGAESDSGRDGGVGLSGHEATVTGKRGDFSLYTGATDVPGSVAGSDDGGGGDIAGVGGLPVEPDAARPIKDAARNRSGSGGGVPRPDCREHEERVNTGFDSEMPADGMILAGYHIEAGTRAFGAYAQAVLDDLGEGARPFLRLWYEAVRHYPGFDSAGMTAASELDAGDVTQSVDEDA